ncbi:MAG: ribosome small subunit-dependent GTPase A [Nevskia sp.]
MSLDDARLRAIGWNAHCAAAWAALENPAGRPARIAEQHRGHSEVHDGERLLKARTMSALYTRLEAAGDGLVVGDWVLITDDGESITIVELLARRSLLQRSRGENGVQRIVANVDTALLVMGLDGDYNPNRMERYLLMVRAAGVAPLIVLTKPDRCETADACRDEIAALADAGTPVQVLDARTAAVREVLAPHLGAGATLVLLGSSGVGKSTLMNTLLGDDSQRTGATREYDDKGRHTTTARTLRLLPQGACLIDTPGVRELRLGGDEDVTADAFEDIAKLALDCRFRDCRHEKEPGCAVVAGTKPERLANYRKLRAELAAAAKLRLEASRAPRRS